MAALLQLSGCPTPIYPPTNPPIHRPTDPPTPPPPSPPTPKRTHTCTHAQACARTQSIKQTPNHIALRHLSHNLICDLVAPLVDLWHIQVVDEEAHAHIPLGTVGGAHALLDDVLHDGLEQPGGCGGGEVALLPSEEVLIGPLGVGGEELLDGDGLGRPRPTHQQHSALLDEAALHEVQQPAK